jgi:hypothetical protein
MGRLATRSGRPRDRSPPARERAEMRARAASPPRGAACDRDRRPGSLPPVAAATAARVSRFVATPRRECIADDGGQPAGLAGALAGAARWCTPAIASSAGRPRRAGACAAGQGAELEREDGPRRRRPGGAARRAQAVRRSDATRASGRPAGVPADRARRRREPAPSRATLRCRAPRRSTAAPRDSSIRTSPDVSCSTRGRARGGAGRRRSTSAGLRQPSPGRPTPRLRTSGPARRRAVGRRRTPAPSRNPRRVLRGLHRENGLESRHPRHPKG